MIKVDREALQTMAKIDIVQAAISRISITSAIHRFIILQDYYEGRHDILDRKQQDPAKPNNKLVNNYAQYITDVYTGYFLGKPVAYTSDKDGDDLLERLSDINTVNNEQNHNAEIGKTASIKGEAYELLWMDSEARVRFTHLEPENVIYIESSDAEPEPVMAIRKYTVEDLASSGTITYYDVYDDSSVVTYQESDGVLTMTGEAEHFFQAVPVVRYLNNKEQSGDFEGVMSLIDAYNIMRSDTANDFEYFTDAYLMLSGMDGTGQTDITAMKEQRVMLIPEGGGANWLIKQINDAATENHNNRLINDIHILSKTPNLNDESFSQSQSGVSIKYKLFPLETSTSSKERNFKKGLQERIRLICNILNVQKNTYNWRDIGLTFTRNLPVNTLEKADVVQKLTGIVSMETLLGLLPFIENPSEELERMENENNGRIDLDMIPEPEPEPAGDDDGQEA